MTSDKNNGWSEWSNKVLSDLRQFRDDIKEIYEIINDLKIEVAVAKAKAALWGAIAGLIISPILSGIIYVIVKLIVG